MLHFRRVLLAMAFIGATFAAGVPTLSVRAQDNAADLLDQLNAIKSSDGDEAADAYFDTLSPEDQAAVMEVATSEVITEDAGDVNAISPMASGCWNRTHTISSTNTVSGSLNWQYSQYVSWCGSGTRTGIYGIGCDASGYAPGFGWSFEGHQSFCTLVFGGAGWTQSRMSSQGLFRACWGASGCPVSSNPKAFQQFESNGVYAGWGEW